MFLEKDERLIILDFVPNPDVWSWAPGESLSILDLQKLERVGVKTITLENVDDFYAIVDFAESVSTK